LGEEHGQLPRERRFLDVKILRRSEVYGRYGFYLGMTAPIYMNKDEMTASVAAVLGDVP